MRHLLHVVLLLSAFLFVAPETASAQTHKDERIGYQIKAPKRWTQIPLKSDEQWIVAKFMCDKVDPKPIQYLKRLEHLRWFFRRHGFEKLGQRSIVSLRRNGFHCRRRCYR